MENENIGKDRSTDENVIQPVSEAVKVDRSLYQTPGFFKLQKKRFMKHRQILWFILPAALFSLIFSYIPMLGVLFAFKDTRFDYAMRAGADILGAMQYSDWTLDTFTSIFNTDFVSSLWNSVLINLIKLIFVFPLSILIAVQLSELKNQTSAKFVLIVICIPNFFSWATVVATWNGFLDPSFGFLGKLLKGATHGEALTYYESWFKPLFIFLGAWKSAGWGCIMYYAAITAIDKTYYESATLEGANKLQKMCYLTIPSIAPTIALMLVMNISGFMGVGLEQLKLMLNSASYYDSQKTLDLYIYEMSIGNGAGVSYVQSAALGVFNGLVGLILMIVGNTITTKTMHRSLW